MFVNEKGAYCLSGENIHVLSMEMGHSLSGKGDMLIVRGKGLMLFVVGKGACCLSSENVHVVC